MRFLALAALFATASTAALAQDSPPAAVREACMSSIMATCGPEAMSGDRASVRACMIRNFDKLTPDCQAAMKAAKAARDAAKPGSPPPADAPPKK